MRLIMIILVLALCLADGAEIKETGMTEARGKGKKYALLIPFFYAAASKLFILKIVYGGILFAVVYKAWHILLWLLKYLKENKHHHVEYEPVFAHDHYGHEFAHEHFDPYEQPVYGRKEYLQNQVYDADGSYSVQI
ncbi:unnamed protein product [Leptosia nina]|uniref:Uncharacterized protein n=1 Tax=Leptosia nina TaxID=320188 RepID=A0AAV1IWM9_9NEOP